MKYKKVSIATVKANFKKGVAFKGFLVGNKVNSFHFFGGWCLACRVEAANLEEFVENRNSFEFYLDAELGGAAAIYKFN